MKEKNKPNKEEAKQAGAFGGPFDEGTAADTSIEVTSGVYKEKLPIAGLTILAVRQKFKDRLDLNDNATAIIDGNEVDNDRVIGVGESLTFLHKSGEKGNGKI